MVCSLRFTRVSGQALSRYDKSFTCPQDKTMSLATAPDHIKLAVDLIEILETNSVCNRTAEQALLIVLDDVRAKIAAEAAAEPPEDSDQS